MRSKSKQLSNFSNAKQSTSDCFRPDNEAQMANINLVGALARGNGSSYSDCCLNDQGVIIDTTRLNHLISFDEKTGLLVCQGSVSFADLFLVNPHYIPAVIPGTLKATVAGGIANDVHGKNNHQQGNFGQHLEWIELQLGQQSLFCDRKAHADLFHATIAGLGLTGVIKRVGLRMRKASQFVVTHSEKHDNWETMLERLQYKGCDYDYQVAWLDLLNEPRALLSFANHCEGENKKDSYLHTVPKLPIRLVNAWLMKLFNRFYFKSHPTEERILSLQQFNNPLDTIRHWNRLYGKNGLLQFQALFDKDIALQAIEELLQIIRAHQAIPTLAVLKLFTQPGEGLLSFAQPGFTLAIDFINNEQARKAIRAMNEWITQARGKIYLAKDLLLTSQQFAQQYPNHERFRELLTHYKSNMRSDMSTRLGITL
ncbi:putative decaprenylphosphoryl-beta-D-ribose oxidase [Legionella massiliensis]|uniref:Putative decaprenylphosphoryl-beta-D-ribose oxidase n=1 Tax=Legionella massiliensis TaxID=1034943 RepID=A0A078L080_9GAMM|nr:FAD-binding oxidoreductase [Legionella massiliensis]CDZ78556.1 putative decaprenylphosphoryl-beta-D-ribose oxidase [Legionella massiliensis]CEE14294.1 putative decaprenylphosphoryl-beta-D-ribose oxidase [Legionella massiliensis]